MDRSTRRAFLACVVGSGAALAGCSSAGPSAEGNATTGGTSNGTAPATTATGATSDGTATTTTDATTADATTTDATTRTETAEPNAEPTTATTEPASAETTTTTRTAATTESSARAATRGLSKQPILGSTPGSNADFVVAFEDPASTACRRFEQLTFPQVHKRLVSNGDLSFAYREYGRAEPWAREAEMALEATYARHEGTFWYLKGYYYNWQEKFTADNVLDRTHAFLAEKTSVNADAVIRDVRNGTYASAVRADVRTARAAGVEVTPTFFLFRDGQFVAALRGHQEYDAFADVYG